MINLELQEILGKLEQGLTAELTKTVDGQTYTRVFLPENRLILLGGRPQAAICPKGFPHLPGSDQYRLFHAPVSGTRRPTKGLRIGAFLHRIYAGQVRRNAGN